jgi:hypothetical protein
MVVAEALTGSPKVETVPSNGLMHNTCELIVKTKGDKVIIFETLHHSCVFVQQKEMKLTVAVGEGIDSGDS